MRPQPTARANARPPLIHATSGWTPGSDALATGFTGAARILWKEPGTGTRLAIIDLDPADRDRFPTRITGAISIAGRPFGWLYDWREVRLNADPTSPTFGQYHPPPNGLSSSGSGSRRAFNRYEAHLPIMHSQDGGVAGWANLGACGVPDALEHCPPRKALIPNLVPVPRDVIVELRAERTLNGQTRFVFDAMTPMELVMRDVPGGGG